MIDSSVGKFWLHCSTVGGLRNAAAIFVYGSGTNMSANIRHLFLLSSSQENYLSAIKSFSGPLEDIKLCTFLTVVIKLCNRNNVTKSWLK